MCGIAGCSFPARKEVRDALKRLSHRGPDGGKVRCDTAATLGTVRLAIVDRDRRALQPMATGGVWASLNGEIYNFRELQERLIREGHAFATACDTEVVLRAYLQWGREAFSMFEGMFAIALRDSRDETIHLARDAMGIKPLYYAIVRDEGQEHLVFASEIKALLAFPQLPLNIDRLAVAEYLAFRFVPGERTLLDGVRRLLPGHHLEWNRGHVHLSAIPRALHTGRAGDLKGLLAEATRRCMQGDAPIGIFLSGGLDSSIIAALCARIAPNPGALYAFSIAISRENDESEFARQAADAAGLAYHKVTYEPLAEDFERIAWFQDDLVSDPVLLANYQLAREAAEHVRVVLCGEGADELFGGYAHYRMMEHVANMMRLPPGLRKAGGRLLSLVPTAAWDAVFPYPASIGSAGAARIHEILNASNPGSAYFPFVRMFDIQDAERLAGWGPRASMSAWSERLAAQPGGTFTERVMRFEQDQWLPHYILKKLDRMTMCHSLEGRVPFLSTEVVDIARTLPLAMKIGAGTNKRALRTAFVGSVPRGILRRKKYPFHVLGDSRFETMLREEVRSMLREAPWPDWLNKYECVWAAKRMDGSILRQRQAFSIVMLLHWLRHFMPGGVSGPAL